MLLRYCLERAHGLVQPLQKDLSNFVSYHRDVAAGAVCVREPDTMMGCDML